MKQLTANRLILMLCLYAAAVLNVGFWRVVREGSQLQHGTDWQLILTMPLLIVAVTNLAFQLLFWPYLHRVLMPLLLLAGSAIAYAVMVQGIYFNSDMLQNVLQTDQAEVSAWLSWKFVGWLSLTGMIPAWLYLRYAQTAGYGRWYQALGWRLLSVLCSLLTITLVSILSYQSHASFFRNFKAAPHKLVPINLVAASIKTAYDTYDASRPFEAIALDAHRITPPHSRKRVLILVVGETTRAKNWGLNPGAPDTTPQLKRIPNIINYPDVSACGTATAISLPCMFSRMSRNDYQPNRARHQEGLMDILQRAGLYTSWRENDGGCKNTCDRIRHIDIRSLAHEGQCNREGCLDMTLLNGLEDEVRDMQNDGVIVLHGMGSHGPTYFQRYTREFRRFTPTCDTSQLQDCDAQALQNTYNNTIVYIDHMLASTIAILNRQANTDAALWYLSDHGESLGEKGMYLHGAPYLVAPREQTHIPMIFWANEGWYEGLGLSADCLRQHANQHYSHDNLFHSMLGIFDVRTREYQPKLDMFASCRTTKEKH